MDTIKMGAYQDRLIKRRRDVLHSLRRLDEKNAQITQKKQLDLIDQASNESEISLLYRLSDGYLRELAQIQVALDRILKGAYGACRACHRPIERRRLDTFPEADFCSRCKETREAFEWCH